MKKTSNELENLVATYRGPITKCEPGVAEGADDLKTWAQRRTKGQSGVPDKDKFNFNSGNWAQLQHSYQKSRLAATMSFREWLNFKFNARPQKRSKSYSSGARTKTQP